MRNVFCLVVLAYVLVSPCMADTSYQSQEEQDLALIYGDKENVSIATGNKQPIIRAPATATVITSHDIQAMGMTDLDQVLETVPGLHISMNGTGLNPIYGFRG